MDDGDTVSLPADGGLPSGLPLPLTEEEIATAVRELVASDPDIQAELLELMEQAGSKGRRKRGRRREW